MFILSQQRKAECDTEWVMSAATFLSPAHNCYLPSGHTWQVEVTYQPPIHGNGSSEGAYRARDPEAFLNT